MTDDPLIGRHLANYRLERLIGRGGMASVYYATDIRLNRPAAVKVIDAHFRAKESFTARFVQEARAVASWRHEHIVQIYYAGDEEGLYYFAMEYIDGTTLAQILTDQTAAGQFLPAADVLRYGRAIASAIDYAHAKGVIHRDVKPLNVLVASDGRVVLTDFGLALDTSQGSLGEVFGTAHYTAPEQARRSNAAVPQSDLYSLGVILYEMLTGVVPFDDPSPTSVALQQITLPPPPPRSINPQLNAEVEAVLLRALAKAPAERYQTGAALMEALAAVLHTFPSGAVASPSQGVVLPPTASRPAPLPPIPAAVSAPLPAAAHRTMRWWPWMIGVAVLCLVLGAAALRLRGAELSPTPAQTPAVSPAPALLPSASPAPADQPATELPATELPLVQPTLAPTTTVPDSEVFSPSATPPPDLPAAPTPTPKYTDRRRFMLYYDNTSLYMKQLTGVGDLIGSLAFERLDASGAPLNRFSANRWAEYSPSSLLNWCYRLEIASAGTYLRPVECEGKYLATLHPDPSDPGVFWTVQEGSTVFRILWRDEELVRCEIAAGTCEVYLP